MKLLEISREEGCTMQLYFSEDDIGGFISPGSDTEKKNFLVFVGEMFSRAFEALEIEPRL